MASGISTDTNFDVTNIIEDTKKVVLELLDVANLEEGDILVVGCSSSEVASHQIGSFSSKDIGAAIFNTIYEITNEKGLYLATQCCEHLNRAIIVERDAVPFSDIVNVVPQPKAGGSFGTTAYKTFANPVAVEEIRADAGIDIGGTLIGMHIKKVAVPVKLEHNKIGEANVLAARVRPKFIGGEREVYNKDLM